MFCLFFQARGLGLVLSQRVKKGPFQVTALSSPHFQGRCCVPKGALRHPPSLSGEQLLREDFKTGTSRRLTAERPDLTEH